MVELILRMWKKKSLNLKFAETHCNLIFNCKILSCNIFCYFEVFVHWYFVVFGCCFFFIAFSFHHFKLLSPSNKGSKFWSHFSGPSQRRHDRNGTAWQKSAISHHLVSSKWTCIKSLRSRSLLQVSQNFCQICRMKQSNEHHYFLTTWQH